MSDRHFGGLMAIVITAPIMIVCCGGGGVILAAIFGGLGGWLSGLGGIATVVVTLGALLFVREYRRYRALRNPDKDAAGCCRQPTNEYETVHGIVRYAGKKHAN